MATSKPQIAHIGFAVEDIESALTFFKDILGTEPSEIETSDGAEIASLQFGDVDIELLMPQTPDSPIGKFIAKRGPGIHHVCLRVPDLDAAIANCESKGYRLIDQKPRIGVGGHRIAFLHPKSTFGILLELTD
jgi:methylmalonyl-CoA/ethylmalonyl-CoA epimerase